MDSAEEMFDVVNADDRVVQQLPRSEVHRWNLWHRAVSIFVFNSRGELLVHLRSTTKDQFPSRYTSSASGHVTAGETYDETAPRELQEELGLTQPVEFLHKFPASVDTAYEFTALYSVTTDEPPRPDPGEIAAIEWWNIDKLATRVEQSPDDFTPPFRVLLAWYIENRHTPSVASRERQLPGQGD